MEKIACTNFGKCLYWLSVEKSVVTLMVAVIVVVAIAVAMVGCR